MYTTSALIHLLRKRYGLNPLGIKKVLAVDTKRYSQLLRGRESLNAEESLRLVTVFEELAGRFVYLNEKDM